MTKLELKKTLDRLDWSQADLAKRMQVTPETVSRWADVPVIVGLYLDALLDHMTDIDQLSSTINARLKQLEATP